MLKIKDNVDLKELEKFGFEKKEHKFENISYWYYCFEEIVIYADDKDIDFRMIDFFKLRTTAADKLFDLIQAGLVEKVEK